MQGADFAAYFSKVYIVSQPSAAGRRPNVGAELSRIGFADGQMIVPRQTVPQGANGYASRAAHGLFLSHLAILKDISNRGIERALIVEDDAIFRGKLVDPAFQHLITAAAAERKWAFWFIGHRLRQGLRGVRRDVAQISRPVSSAQCYGVQARVVDDLIGSLSAVLTRPVADPGVSRPDIGMAIDRFRKAHPEHLCLISNPALSIRRGNQEEPGQVAQGAFSAAIEAGRRARDEFWRRTGIDFRSGR